MSLLKVKELLPEQLLNSFTFSVVITDLTGKFVYVNPLFQQKFSHISTTLTNHHFADTVYAEDIKPCNEAARECIRNPEKPVSITVRKACEGDEFFWTHWEISAIKNEQGQVIGTMSVGHDVTTTELNNNKTTELLNSRAYVADAASSIYSDEEITRLALVAHNDNNAVVIADKAENIIWVNAGFTRILGYKSEEIKGKNLFFYLQQNGVDPKILKRIQYSLENKLAFTEQLQIKNNRDKAIWLEISCKPLFDDANVHIGFIANEDDITKRKHAEQEQQETLQRLSLATDSAQIGVWEVDILDGTTFWDEKMYDLYGFAKNTLFAPLKIFKKALHPEDKELMKKVLGGLAEGKKSIDSVVYRINMPNGNIRYIEAHAIVQKSAEGIPIRLIGTNRDITDDIAVQEKMKTQNKVLRDIAFIQSHEVRRPLANILGVIEVLNSSNSVQNKEIFDHLIQSANELDMQIRSIVKKTNNLDGIFSKG
ncbi:PAS domain S-box protein [Sediminibacterium sp.]|uniref:PAS domain-containing protein n=1 Tax=Sediminibacterium sp. TaxID=1917865 RepID=UPI003F70EA3B